MQPSTSDIDTILKKFPEIRQESLIPILQEIQDTVGYISEDAIIKISSHLKLASSKIYGVASFYNQFRFRPKGKYHIQVCYGTACHLFGASTFLKEIEKMLKIKDNETTRDNLFSLEVQTCIGGCGQAPVISINGDFYGKLTYDKLEQIISTLRHQED
jgi:NADH-quinone oxidoreductase E subunit